MGRKAKPAEEVIMEYFKTADILRCELLLSLIAFELKSRQPAEAKNPAKRKAEHPALAMEKTA